MRGGIRAREIRVGSVALAVAAALLTAAGASADDPASLRDRAERLAAESVGLAGRERPAVLELYALGSRLARADAHVAALRRESAAVEAERAAAEERLAFVRENLAAAERYLAERLRALYVEGDPDPLAVLLGAESLDEALTALDSLGRFARRDKEIVAEVQVARAAVKGAIADLEREQAKLAALTAEAEAARDAVAAAQAERASYLASVRAEQRLNAAQIAELTAAAAAAEDKAAELVSESPPATPSSGEPSPAPSPSPPPAPPPGGRKLTVQATGYALHGTTATGIQTGWGVVAVDPSVIPLGTKMYVPGYGEGVAADTGSAVKGHIIDLWFPTREQALQWGRRTVTITLH